MMSRLVFVASIFLLTLMLMGCGPSANQPATPGQPNAATTSSTGTKQAPKEPILYTAKQCFANMLSVAQRWQRDALPFHMESEVNAEATGQDGKATVWRALFASRNRGTMETVICSGSRLPGGPAFGFSSTAETASAANVPALMFDPSYFQSDSDKAFATTLEHGGSALLKKDPKQPVFYLLDWDPKQKSLFWYVIYGTSSAERKGLAVTNATTGAFLRAGK